MMPNLSASPDTQTNSSYGRAYKRRRLQQSPRSGSKPNVKDSDWIDGVRQAIEETSQAATCAAISEAIFNVDDLEVIEISDNNTKMKFDKAYKFADNLVPLVD
jgi:hypothetical protein